MNASKNNSLIKQLQEIASSRTLSIKAYVAKEALYYSENEIHNFFSDLLQYGCVSGIIGSLIYYYDTHKFYDDFYNQIENLRYDYEDSVGQPLTIKGDLKNFMTWFAFEETAYQLANELGLEI